jgi:AcrR family transcriptional regulator
MPREALLDRALEAVREHGWATLSLRQLAHLMGTSHRMLIYHFGSKEGLLAALVQSSEDAERRTADLTFGPDGPDTKNPGELLRAHWNHLADPAVAPRERLFFELYGQALQGVEPAASLLPGLVDDWLELADETERTAMRLALAVIRGLLLDLLATGDRTGCDAAFELYVSRIVERRG